MVERRYAGRGGRYVQLNREAARMLAENGRDAFAGLVSDMNRKTRGIVADIGKSKRRRDEARREAAGYGQLERRADRMLETADSAIGMLVALMLKMWAQRRMYQRQLEIAKREKELEGMRPAKWEAENRENAARKTLDRFDEWVSSGRAGKQTEAESHGQWNEGGRGDAGQMAASPGR